MGGWEPWRQFDGMAQRLQGGLVGGGAIDLQQGAGEQRRCDPSGVGMGVTYPQACPTQANWMHIQGKGLYSGFPVETQARAVRADLAT